jgi:hypothetical protein
MKLLMKIAGVNEERLRDCPPEDWGTVRALAEIQIGVWALQSMLFSWIGHKLAGAEYIRPDLIVIGMFVAGLIGAIDSYVIVRSGWYLEGLKIIARGGLDISGGGLEWLKAKFFLALRIFLSIGLAQITAIFLSLLVYGSDINARTQEIYHKANAHLIGPATQLIEGNIRRAADAYDAQVTFVNELVAQTQSLRQNVIEPSANQPTIGDAQREVARLTDLRTKADAEVEAADTFATNEFGGIKGAPQNTGKPGFGLRYRAAMERLTKAKARAGELQSQLITARARLDALRKDSSSANDVLMQRAQGQLPEFVKNLDAENAKLVKLKDELARLTSGREAAIRAAVENAPDFVAVDGGFIAQLKMLQRMSDEDPMIKIVVILVDVVAFGLELAAVMCKIAAFIDTTYAANLARDSYMRAVKIVDEMTDQLRGNRNSEPEIPPTEPPAPEAALECPFCEQPLKRKRGRPRKHPLPTIVTNSNGQGGPGSPSGRPAPA